MSYTPSQWRCFDRCLLGLQKFKKLHKRVRFLTLTLPACNCVYVPCQSTLDGVPSLEHDSRGKKELIQILWRILYKRMVKEFGPIPYFSVRTPEGNGVLHVVLACDYIPFEWLMENWVEIAGTCYLWICDPYDSKRFRRYRNRIRNPSEVAHYLMTQYLGGQPDFTYGFSSDWVYRGFSGDYRRLRSECRDFNAEPIFVDYGMVVYPIDVGRLREAWEALMDKKVYHPDVGFAAFKARVKAVSGSDYGYERYL